MSSIHVERDWTSATSIHSARDLLLSLSCLCMRMPHHLPSCPPDDSGHNIAAEALVGA